MMRSGALRHRLAIQSAVEARTANGDVSRAWATEATRWASVAPLEGKELEVAARVDARVTHEVRLRHYAAGLDPGKRFLHGTRVLNIVRVLNVDERSRELRCLVIEAV